MSGQFWTEKLCQIYFMTVFIAFHLCHKIINSNVYFQAYLEQQIEEYERVEQERMEERQIQTKKILERMKIEQSNTIEGIGIFQGVHLNGTIFEKYVLQCKRFNLFI